MTGTEMVTPHPEIESRYAWIRLAASFALLTIGGSSMFVVVVAMPVIELEFSRYPLAGIDPLFHDYGRLGVRYDLDGAPV